MARPIKDTPILYGKDAIRMLKEVENVVPFPPFPAGRNRRTPLKEVENVVPFPPEFIERIKRDSLALEKIQKNSYEEAGIRFE